MHPHTSPQAHRLRGAPPGCTTPREAGRLTRRPPLRIHRHPPWHRPWHPPWHRPWPWYLPWYRYPPRARAGNTKPARFHGSRPIRPRTVPGADGTNSQTRSTVSCRHRQLPPPSVVRVRRQRSTANDRRGRRVPEGRRGGAPAACSGGPAHRVWSRGSCPMVTKALPRPAGAAGGRKPGGHARTRTPARGHTAGHQAGPSHARPQPDPPDQVHPQAWHRPDEVHVMITNSPRSARTRLLQHVPAPLPPPCPLPPPSRPLPQPQGVRSAER